MTAAEAAALLAGAGRPALARFLGRQRWFAARGHPPREVDLVDWAAVTDRPALLLALVAADGVRYAVPVAASARATAPQIDAGAEILATGDAVLYDAHVEPEFGRRLLGAIAGGVTLPGARGRFEGRTPGPWPGPDAEELKSMSVQPVGAEQSNTSLRFDRRFILKSLRRPVPGPNPEFEVTHFLATRTGFAQTPGLAGWIDHVDGHGARTTVALLQPWIEHQGDGWSWTLITLRALVEDLLREPPVEGAEGIEARLRELAGDFAEELRALGAVTGGLHAALASDRADPAFSPERITAADAGAWAASIEEEARQTLALVRARRPSWPPGAAPALEELAATAPDVSRLTAPLGLLAETGVHRIRCHGDYHLGQVLRAHGTFLVIDFEGEPSRPLVERRAKQPGLRDVAGMLRSFSYAARSALRERPAAEQPALAPWLDAWERLVGDAFRRGYLAGVGEGPTRLVPPADQQVRAVSAVFELEKALYELRYELGHRPEWVEIPLAGLSRMMASP